MKKEVMSYESCLDEDQLIDHSVSALNNRINAKNKRKKIDRVLGIAYELDKMILSNDCEIAGNQDIKRLFDDTDLEELTIACASIIEMNTNREIPQKEFLEYCMTMLDINKSNNSYEDKFKMISSEVRRCLTRELFPSLYC